MIRRPRIPGYGRNGAGNVDDTDALQTDVMRFMSILGLCLMAVFALVQSLPLNDSGPDPQATEAALLTDQISGQRQRVQALDAELQQLLAKVERVSAKQADKVRALSQAEQRLVDVIDQTVHAEQRQRRILDELEGLQQHLNSGRIELADLQQTIDDKGQSLQAMQRRLDRESSALDEIRQAAREVKREQDDEQSRQTAGLVSTAQTAAAKRQSTLSITEAKRQSTARTEQAAVAATPKSKTKKQGFTLRFVSDEALRRLVRNDDVQLFGMLDRRAWRVSQPGQPGRRPVLVDVEFPRWFHEMAPSTVPPDYVRQLQVFVDPQTAGAVVWGVQLPQVTRQDIASLTKGLRGGDLIIEADGRVRLAGE